MLIGILGLKLLFIKLFGMMALGRMKYVFNLMLIVLLS